MFNIKKNKADISLIVLFSIFPLSILTGNLLINLTILIISLVFLYKLIKKEFNVLDYKESYNLFCLLLFFLISLSENLIFSNDIYLSYPES